MKEVNQDCPSKEKMLWVKKNVAKKSVQGKIPLRMARWVGSRKKKEIEQWDKERVYKRGIKNKI